MVMRAGAPAETDLFVVGGGPAGLAAALAARKHGLRVIVADRAQPPIDKACGEGIMPDGAAALREIGVELTTADGVPFGGIRFLDGEIQAEARFPNCECGFGIRRTRLHQILTRAAEEAGAVLWWQSPVEVAGEERVTAGGRQVRCRWIAGADGVHSRVREGCGLQPIWSTARRIGLRQHFLVEPWTNFVEVYWGKNCQAYVTPTGPDEICVVLLGTAKELSLETLPATFPKLAGRLAGAKRLGAARGGMSTSLNLAAVTKGNVALLGDASGTVDAVTGEGLHLAFRQAAALGDALAAAELSSYSAAHTRLQRMPQHMARLLLLLDGNECLRRIAFRSLAAVPALFNTMLAFHAGSRPASSLCFKLLDHTLRMFAPPQTPVVSSGINSADR